MDTEDVVRPLDGIAEALLNIGTLHETNEEAAARILGEKDDEIEWWKARTRILERKVVDCKEREARWQAKFEQVKSERNKLSNKIQKLQIEIQGWNATVDAATNAMAEFITRPHVSYTPTLSRAHEAVRSIPVPISRLNRVMQTLFRRA